MKLFWSVLVLLFSFSSVAIDLTGAEVSKPKSWSDKQWFNKFDLSGFFAGGFVKTGANGNQPSGHLAAREATIFFEAESTENVIFYLEWQAIRLAAEESKVAGQTGEVYAHFKNVAPSLGDGALGVKVGRIDIPFGEEYLWQDASDNLLISPSAGYPYGFDEGILLYGTAMDIGWILSVTDGDDDRSTDDDNPKAINAKLTKQFTDSVYLSASYMKNGDATKSAFEFGGAHFESADGATTKVDADLFSIDAIIKIGSSFEFDAYYGQAKVTHSIDSTLDRDITFYMAQAVYHITDSWYTIARYSAIGTFDDTKGYHFDGKPFAGGNSAGGFEVKEFSRASVGFGCNITHKARLKVEFAQDEFTMINGATNDPGDDRDFYGAEVAIKF